MGDSPTRGLDWSRLGAEFVVIVVGVLAALAVDSLVSASSDRELEGEYLARLIDDVHFDLSELAFIDSISRVSEQYGDSLMDLGFIRTATPDRLVGAVFLASNAREPDLSRSTFQELISSGRIGLIESSAIRLALARYDRQVMEQEGFWTFWAQNSYLTRWAFERIPLSVNTAFEAACQIDEGFSEPLAEAPCPFPMGNWPVEQLRGDLQTVEAQRLLRANAYRARYGRDIVGNLSQAVQELRETLERESRR